METQELFKYLQDLDSQKRYSRLENLEKRKLAELQFHDRHRDYDERDQLSEDNFEKLYGNKKYYRTVRLSTEYTGRWIKNHCKDKIFLDYACGDGGRAIEAAKAGADLSIGIDLSGVSIENARNNATSSGVSANTFFLQADCENTKLPSKCIDVCAISGVLHHLDLSYAFPELRRIMNSEGAILAIEALDYNPFIKLYRELTPEMRTEWEKKHILTHKDLEFAKRFFDVRNVKYWHLASIAGAYFPSALPMLNKIDQVMLQLPILKKMAWIFTFELHSN